VVQFLLAFIKCSVFSLNLSESSRTLLGYLRHFTDTNTYLNMLDSFQLKKVYNCLGFFYIELDFFIIFHACNTPLLNSSEDNLGKKIFHHLLKFDLKLFGYFEGFWGAHKEPM
jgi:hypothetical protein